MQPYFKGVSTESKLIVLSTRPLLFTTLSFKTRASNARFGSEEPLVNAAADLKLTFFQRYENTPRSSALLKEPGELCQELQEKNTPSWLEATTRALIPSPRAAPAWLRRRSPRAGLSQFRGNRRRGQELPRAEAAEHEIPARDGPDPT